MKKVPILYNTWYYAMCSIDSVRVAAQAERTLPFDTVVASSIAQSSDGEGELGKVNTLLIKTLWLQEAVKSRASATRSSPSKLNKADLGRHQMRACGRIMDALH